MWVAHEWMDIEVQLCNGEAHTLVNIGKPGSLALRCFSCPQPGFNLPEDENTSGEV
jgi:hypothetical protein